MSNHLTGPEEYKVRKAQKGTYKIEAKYYGSHQQSLTGGTTILLTIFTNYARKGKEECKQVTLRLNQDKEKIHVADITV
jgi:Ca-activated chloride channel family protein